MGPWWLWCQLIFLRDFPQYARFQFLMLEKSPNNNTLLGTLFPQIRQPFNRDFLAPLLDHTPRNQGHHFLQPRRVDEGELFRKIAALKLELFRSVPVLHFQSLKIGPRRWVREVHIIGKQHFSHYILNQTMVERVEIY
uniref:Putative secreted protein n=1 Tax=Anopheles marajoara TaxID=58244 RepID=A0A2M4C6N4_9DIPT